MPEGLSFSYLIVVFIVITLVVIAILTAAYYLNKIKNGKTLTPSQINTLLIFLVIVGILAFILWLGLLYSMFSGRSEDHHHHYKEQHIVHREVATPAALPHIVETHSAPNHYQNSYTHQPYSPESYPGHVIQHQAPTVYKEFVPAASSIDSPLTGSTASRPPVISR
jgi:NADH:ubiquinone oxidoreductase subunit 5 (subunit L)/multisubunit Na+/H+ antiporter MnhA subunit